VEIFGGEKILHYISPPSIHNGYHKIYPCVIYNNTALDEGFLLNWNFINMCIG